MGICGSKPGKWSHDNSMAKCNISDLHCLEEFRGGHVQVREGSWHEGGLRKLVDLFWPSCDLHMAP